MKTGTPEAQPMSCSIVIRAYNEERHIGRLLDGIQHQQRLDPEVILVDSGSTDRTLEIAARYPVRVLHIEPIVFSFGRSLNLGIAAARHERIVIASAHVYPVYPDWLERLLAPLDDPNTALSYGRQRGDGETHFSEQQIFARWFPEASNLRQAYPFCNNANAAIRRSIWERIPYDENLTGLEDLAWARLAMEQGFGVAYTAEAEVVHVHQETPEGVYNRYRREAMAYKQIFPSERFTFADFLSLLGSNILSDLRNARRGKSLRNSMTGIFWFRWMQFWGTYQGYRRPGLLTEQLRRTFYYPHHPAAQPAGFDRDVEPIRYGD